MQTDMRVRAHTEVWNKVSEIAELIRSLREKHQCIRCGRKLTDPESIERQMGDECYRKMLEASEKLVQYGWNLGGTSVYDLDEGEDICYCGGTGDQCWCADTPPLTLLAWCPRCDDTTLICIEMHPSNANEAKCLIDDAYTEIEQQEILAMLVEDEINEMEYLTNHSGNTECCNCGLEYMTLDMLGEDEHPDGGFSQRRLLSEPDSLQEVYEDSRH